MLSQPFYYQYWFWCKNPDCKTQQIMPEEARVKPRPVEKPVTSVHVHNEPSQDNGDLTLPWDDE